MDSAYQNHNCLLWFRPQNSSQQARPELVDMFCVQALSLLIWSVFPLKFRECPLILMLDKKKGGLGKVNWQQSSQWVIIVYDVQFKSQIFQQFMYAIMPLICSYLRLIYSID